MTEKEAAEALRSKGYGVVPPDQYLIDMEPEFKAVWESVRAYTMTSAERAYGLYKAVEYCVKAGIKGDFVECGVWKGGSCMLMALALKEFNGASRKLWLYDTFSGMTEPTPEDVIAWNSRPVSEKWEEDRKGIKNNFGSWAVGLPEVQRNLESTGYDPSLVEYVVGDVAVTLDEQAPEKIALLRLDTDWYESTRKELESMYPRLASGGILIIDDYGHFKGARKAVDEYFAGTPVYFSRLDYTGRILVKP